MEIIAEKRTSRKPAKKDRSLGEELSETAALWRCVSIDELDLASATREALERAEVRTAADLLALSRSELASLEGLDAQEAEAVAGALRSHMGTEAPSVCNVDPNMRTRRDPKTGFVLPPDHKSIELDRSLSNLFDVDEREFEEVPVEALGLRTRPLNCLTRAGVETLGQLLDMTTRELEGIRSMGEGSLQDIFQKAQAYMASAPASRGYVRTIDLDENPAFRAALEALLEGREVDSEQLGREMSAVFSDYEKAVEAVGEEICLTLYLDPKYGGKIVEVLTEFGIRWARWTQSLKEAQALLDQVPQEILDKPLLPFMKAFMAQNGSLEAMEARVAADTPVSALVEVGEDMKKAGENPRCAKRLNSLATWLSFSLPSLMDQIIQDLSARSRDNGERLRGILVMRAEGNVLEKTGAAYGITRERVRQILAGAARKFWGTLVMLEHDIVLSTYAVLGGPPFITEDDLVGQLGVLGHFVWTCVEDDPSPTGRPYVHVAELGVVAFRLDDLKGWSPQRIRDAVRKAQKALPEHVLDTELDEAARKAARDAGAPEAIGRLAARDAYGRTGRLYHKGRLSRMFMYGYVLREFFPNGYRIGVDTSAFREHMRDVFGDKMAEVATDHALDAKATELGVICGRGCHMHPDYLKVDQETLDLVRDYIRASPRSVVLYSQIYKDLEDKLKDTPLKDKYLIQGALKKYGCEYSTCRDFVRKSAGATLGDEMEAYMEQRGRVSRQELMEVFPALCDATLSQIATRNPRLLHIDDGWYAHVNQFDIRDEDYAELREFLLEETANGPLSSGAACRKLSESGCGLMERNKITSKRHLFSILRHMFDGEFSFSRPYITRSGEDHVTNRDAVLHHLAGKECVEVGQLVDMCREHGIHYISIGSLCRLLGPDYARVDARRLMRRDVAGVTDEAERQTREAVKAWLDEHGWVTAMRAPEVLDLPELAVPWTDFLVDSIVSQDKDIEAIRAHRSPFAHPNVIYVGGKHRGDTFEELLKDVIESRRVDGKLVRRDVLAWLREQGLIGRFLPPSVDENAKWTPERE